MWFAAAGAAALVLLLIALDVAVARRGGDKTVAADKPDAKGQSAQSAQPDQPDQTDQTAPSKQAEAVPLRPPAPTAAPEAPNADERPGWDRITLPNTGKWALHFDGEDDYVAIPSLTDDGTSPHYHRGGRPQSGGA